MSRPFRRWLLGGCLLIAALEAPDLGALLLAGPDAPSAAIDLTVPIRRSVAGVEGSASIPALGMPERLAAAGLAIAPRAGQAGF
jgi:hypothetical protein